MIYLIILKIQHQQFRKGHQPTPKTHAEREEEQVLGVIKYNCQKVHIKMQKNKNI